MKRPPSPVLSAAAAAIGTAAVLAAAALTGGPATAEIGRAHV